MHNEDYKYSLEAILSHLEICESRFLFIESPDDFVNTNQGIILLDSIVTRLQAIGKNVKSILRKSNSL